MHRNAAEALRQDGPLHLSVGRLYSLDLLRGLCALWVAIFHLRSWSDIPIRPEIEGFLAFGGTYGVSVFFVLSGYSLTHAYQDKFKDSISSLQFLKYIRRRFARISPLYAAVLILSSLGSGIISGKTPDWVEILANIFLIFGAIDPSATPVIGGWSIGVEVVFYVLFPIIILAQRQRLVVIMLSMGMTAWISQNLTSGTSLSAVWPTYVSAFNHLVFFVGGVYLRLAIRSSSVLSGLKLFVGLAGLALGLAFACSGATELDMVTGWRRLLLVLMVFGVVGAFALWQPRKGLNPFCKFFGGVSYPLYLVHPLAYFALAPFFHVTIWLVIGVAMLSIAAAFVVDRFLDAPVQRRLRDLGW